MHLERRVTYCYSGYDCEQAHQNRSIYLGIGICVSLCSLLITLYRYYGRKKARQVQFSASEIRDLASNRTNAQPKPEEYTEEQLPPYSGRSQGAQADLNNPQNPSLPLYPVPLQDVNNGQSRECTAGEPAPANNSQLNTNQPNPPNSDTPVSSPALNDQVGNINNSDTIQYPAPAQPRLDQRQENPLNNSSTTNHDQNVNTQPATDNLTNNTTTTPQSTQRL